MVCCLGGHHSCRHPGKSSRNSTSSTGRTKICWDGSCPGSSSSAHPTKTLLSLPCPQKCPRPTPVGIHPRLGLQASQHPLSHGSQLPSAAKFRNKKGSGNSHGAPRASPALWFEPSLGIFRAQAAQLLTNTSSEPRTFQRKSSPVWGVLYRTHIIQDYGGAKLNPVYINTALCSKKSPFYLYLPWGRAAAVPEGSWSFFGVSVLLWNTLQGRRRFLKQGLGDYRTSQQSSMGKLQVGIYEVNFYLSEIKTLHFLVLNKWTKSFF